MFTTEQALNVKKIIRFGQEMLNKALADTALMADIDPNAIEFAEKELLALDNIDASVGVIDLDLHQLHVLFKHISIIYNAISQLTMFKSLGMDFSTQSTDNDFLKFSEEQVSYDDLRDLADYIASIGKPMEEAQRASLADSEGNPLSIDTGVRH